MMEASVKTLEKLQILESLYQAGYRSNVVQRTIDKLIALEQDRIRSELSKLKARLQAFEARYKMSSEDFFQRYEQGELGDSADFMEWSSFCDMAQSEKQHLDQLTGKHH